MAVRIRMKKLGRKHRPFYRICAMDSRTARNGRVLEELGTYDPMIPETDARTVLKNERVQYWLSVGALPSDKVGVLIKKYGVTGTHLEQQRQAYARLTESRRRRAPAQPQRSSKPAPEQAEGEPAEAAEGGEE